MKKTAILVTSLLCLELSASQSQNPFEFFELGIHTLKMDYKEYSESGAYLDGDSSDLFGDMNGFSLKGQLHITERYYMGASLEYTKGKSSYDGSTWGGTPLKLTKDNVSIFQPEIYAAAIERLSYADLFSKIGFGYREWKRGKSDYAGDYDETYKWKYLYIEAGGEKELNEKFSLGLSLRYQKAFDAEMRAYLYDGADFELKNTFGYRIEIPLGYKIAKDKELVLFYRFDYWKINNSDPVPLYNNGTLLTYVYEPDSETQNSYVGIKFRYYWR